MFILSFISNIHFLGKEIEDATILLVSSSNNDAASVCSFLSLANPAPWDCIHYPTRPEDSGIRGPGRPLEYCVSHIESLVYQSTNKNNFSPFNLSLLISLGNIFL